MLKPFLTLDEAYNLVLSKETQRNLHMQDQPFIEFVIMANYVDGKKKTKSKRDLIGNHCGKIGHTKQKGYRLIGFLAYFKFTKGNINPKKPSPSINSVTTSAQEARVEETACTMSQFSLVANHESSFDDDPPILENQFGQQKPSLVNSTVVGMISNYDGVPSNSNHFNSCHLVSLGINQFF